MLPSLRYPASTLTNVRTSREGSDSLKTRLLEEDPDAVARSVCLGTVVILCSLFWPCLQPWQFSHLYGLASGSVRSEHQLLPGRLLPWFNRWAPSSPTYFGVICGPPIGV